MLGFCIYPNTFLTDFRFVEDNAAVGEAEVADDWIALQKPTGNVALPANSHRRRKAVNKSAASAASLEGFSSRDQVGC